MERRDEDDGEKIGRGERGLQCNNTFNYIHVHMHASGYYRIEPTNSIFQVMLLLTELLIEAAQLAEFKSPKKVSQLVSCPTRSCPKSGT